jgi:hypothetical protein
MEHIVHLPEFSIVVCRECAYAVLPSHINTHFARTRPHGFTQASRQRIVEAVASIEGLVADEEELRQREFPFPADTSTPIGTLAPPRTGGLRCTVEGSGRVTCTYVATTRQRMREHSAKQHGWRSTNKGGH